jgi:hypothetical protein
MLEQLRLFWLLFSDFGSETASPLEQLELTTSVLMGAFAPVWFPLSPTLELAT